MDINPDQAVNERYTRAARQAEAQLCCPVEYDEEYLKAIPREVIERDYGCGNPTPFLRPGETVLDLGSGAGKNCFIAAQVVSRSGRIIGVDFNEEMLAIARRCAPLVAEKLGFANVEFRRARIEDLRTDWDKVDGWLKDHPIVAARGLLELENFIQEIRRSAPLVADESVDAVISNCVLNLLRPESKLAIFGEIYRVLKRGGRAVISDIVSDEPVQEHLKNDPDLWSGCVSGALEQSEFLGAFERAGFFGVEILKRDSTPWRTVEGIEFRSVTVRAWKGKEGACWEHNQAVIYRGPWRKVEDDDGHTLVRGEPMAVCEKTFRIYTSEPYEADVIPVPPLTSVAADEVRSFDCSRPAARHPRETKGLEYKATTGGAGTCCGPDGCR
jgi:arsenite methyltransferase